MTTLKDLIIAKKCRKGKSHTITDKGAFWLACDEIQIEHNGSDGIGNNASSNYYFLQLRHYRNGEVGASIRIERWHQNHSTRETWIKIPNLLPCTNCEQIIVELLSVKDSYSNSVYHKYFESKLIESLINFGLPECDPSPDEE